MIYAKVVSVILFISLSCHIIALDSPSADEILKKNNLYKPEMTAQDLNAAGMKLYRQKKFQEAELVFYKAVQMNSDHVLANYNLACVLAIIYGNDRKSGREYFPHEVFHYLNISVLHDERRKQRALEDPDFESVRDFLEFRVITAPKGKPITETVLTEFYDVNSFEGDVQLIFKDSSGKELWFGAGDDAFLGYNFYDSVPNENMTPPEVTVNRSFIGMKFRIKYEYVMKWGDFSGIYNLSKKVVSIEKVK